MATSFAATRAAALAYLELSSPPHPAQLSELYDNDAELQSALCELIPGFEYPDFAHMPMDRILKKCRLSVEASAQAG